MRPTSDAPADSASGIFEHFAARAAARPDAGVWRTAVPGADGEAPTWRGSTYREVASRIEAAAALLASHGVSPGDRVAVISNTREEWLVADLAVLRVGAVSVAIYPSLSDRDTGFILHETGTKVVFAENQEQVDKLGRLVASGCDVPACESGPGGHARFAFDAVVTFEPVTSPLPVLPMPAPGDGPACPPAGRERGDTASLVYTSGTTGVPKGVVQTHGNHLANVRQASESGIFGEDGCLFLYLPLAHSFARLVGYLGLLTDATLAFPRVASRVDSRLDLAAIASDVAHADAEYLPTVPRFLEKVRAKIRAAASGRGVSARLLAAALAAGEEERLARRSGGHPGVLASIRHGATEPIRRKVRRKVFGARFRHAISGGAKLPPDVHRFFDALGVPVFEGYGLTETCVATNVNLVGHDKPGSVGPAFRDVETRIGPDGEIFFRGPNVAAGYYRRPAETAAAWSSDGWFATGDVGRLDEDGFLYVTDRKKDLIVTAGGKKVAPVRLEQLVKAIPGVSQAVVFGDDRPYCVALVTLDPAAGGRPEEIRASVAAGIDAVNAGLAPFEQVKRHLVLPEDFTVESGLLTPSQKTRRQEILRRYAAEVESLYAAPTGKR